MTRLLSANDMKHYLIIIFSLYAGQLMALDCAIWKYPPTEDASQLSDEASLAEYSRGLLWRVRNSSGDFSYVFGTIHLSDPRVIELSKFVEPYLTKVDNFAMEVLVTADTPVLLSQKMFYANGQELGDYLTADVFNRTLSLLRQHGLEDYVASRLKPWAAYMTLSVPPSDNKSVPLDMHLLDLANDKGLSTFGVESLEEQLAIFENFVTEEQVSLLTESICNYAENQAQINVMLDAYLNQDLGSLLSLGEKYRTPVNDDLMKRLLDDRNHTMAGRITPWLEAGGYFIALGALHLPGKRGLLWLLEQQGYQLEAVEATAR